MANPIKSVLPRSLFGRALLIIVSPLVLVQVISTYFFYDQHWGTLSRRLSLGVAGDVVFLVELLEQYPSELPSLLETAGRATWVAARFEPDAILPNRPVATRSSVARELDDALHDRLLRPYLIRDQPDDNLVTVSVQLTEGVLETQFSRKRLFSSTIYVFVLWMVGSSMILFAVAGAFMRNQVRPIRRLADAAERFGKGQEVATTKVEGATEVRRAAYEFNRMRERITRQIQQRTEMLAGVSHDLRTPLTRMKLQLAMLGEGQEIADLRTDVDEMERMVDAYLSFVRGEGSEIAVETDLKDILEDAVAGARRGGADVVLEVSGPLPLVLRPDAIRRAVANLIGNACRYGRSVVVRARRGQSGVDLTIDDDGPGIPPERREEVFKPFFRLDASRNLSTGGVGLGLTIARDLVRGHGGDISLEDSPSGGLRARLRLPA